MGIGSAPTRAEREVMPMIATCIASIENSSALARLERQAMPEMAARRMARKCIVKR